VFGTYGGGAISDCSGGQTSGCELINWPGHRTTAWHHEAKTPDVRTWYGSLVDGMRDASGQMYMRNRYYDPATGQFTQPDPIGLAGGLNSYGFAAGDPVSYNDPYGLYGCSIREPWKCRIAGLTASIGTPSLRARGRLGPLRGEIGAAVEASTTRTLMGNMSVETSTTAGGSAAAVIGVGSRSLGPQGSCTVGSGCSGSVGTGSESNAASASNGAVGFSLTVGPVTLGVEVDLKETAIASAGGVVAGVELLSGSFSSLISPFKGGGPSKSLGERLVKRED
jgi:RHS repeat-associated protein